MNGNKFRIRIEIAGKYYSLDINREEEELKRSAAKGVQKKYERCLATYLKSAEREDLLAMVAFKLAEENVLVGERNETAPFIEKIQQMTNELEAYLNRI